VGTGATFPDLRHGDYGDGALNCSCHRPERRHIKCTGTVIRSVVNWEKRFVPAIPLPDGGELVMPHDARAYILKLPKAAQQSPAWQNGKPPVRAAFPG
jgi:hypothetical protein